MEFLNLFLLPIFLLFAVLMINQDLKERKVSNKLNIIFFIIAFIYFIYSIFIFDDLIRFDFMLLIFFILLSFIIYKKNIWGAADGKIFISIILILMGFGGSEYSLKFILNLFVFYLLTMLFLITTSTKNLDKKKIFKKIDIIESSLFIVIIFFLIRIIFFIFKIPIDNPYSIIFFFVLIFLFIDIVKTLIKPYIKRLHHDSKVLVFFFFFELLALYSGGFTFIIIFVLVLIFKTTLQMMSELADNVSVKKRKKYESPFSIYLFFAAFYTLIANYSILELLFFI